KDPMVKTVVLTGAGSVFCGGEGIEYFTRTLAYDFGQHVEDAKMYIRLAQIIYSLRKPVVAKVNGLAHGAGCLLATVCDYVVASEKASFGFIEAHHGLIPALALPFLVKKIGEGRAREMMLRGHIVTAAQAKVYGLVTAVAPPEYLDSEVAQITTELCTQVSSASMGLMKEMFATLDGMKLSESIDYAANMHAAARMTDDGKKGVAAIITREKLTW
ncbi:MAG TPA: enoyl-CoA hydratase/isomerase family protein, partial [Bacteroidota bacterium]|nr:enoyl-CoA hydratase/isomerase family protein [Bacteroidota bacterium]